MMIDAIPWAFALGFVGSPTGRCDPDAYDRSLVLRCQWNPWDYSRPIKDIDIFDRYISEELKV